MAKPIALQANIRKEVAKAVRQQGALPGIVYGHGVEPKSVQVDGKAFSKVFEKAGYTSLISLNVDDKEDHMTLVREVQRHPVRDTIMHVDFYQVRLDEKITANVPLLFVGEAPSVKDLGGVLVRQLDEVEVEALPQDLQHDIEVNISGLDNFDKVIHVSDLPVSEGVTILHEADEVVALVQAPKSQEEIDAELAEEISEDVEGVEGVQDKPEEGEEGAAEGEAAPEESEENSAS